MQRFYADCALLLSLAFGVVLACVWRALLFDRSQVTFSKKLQAAGFFHTSGFRPNSGYRNFNTWLGDPIRALQLKVIADTIRNENLLENVRVTGDFLLKGLKRLENREKRRNARNPEIPKKSGKHEF